MEEFVVIADAAKNRFAGCDISTKNCATHVTHAAGGAVTFGIYNAVFAAGRTAAEQDAVFSDIALIPIAPLVLDAMGIIISYVLAAQNATGYSAARPPAYYMLCDDEEIDTLDDGSMDGTVRVRAACAEWNLIVLYTPQTVLVQFSGYPRGWDPDPVGCVLKMRPAVNEAWEHLYDISEVLDGDAHAKTFDDLLSAVSDVGRLA